MAQPVELPSKIEVGPVIDEGHSLASVSDKIGGIVLKRKITIGWVFGFLIAFSVLQLLMGAASWLIIKGVGIWGINIPIGWGFAIVNFVWWIGIGHAGTLISAILLLLNQSWRNAINRFAEAMTIFAVMCAGMFPVLHTGRPWLAYWLLPYPNTMWLWPQFRSPLVWDVFAVSTYLTISAVFWYVGLIPDFATLRDSAKQRWKQVIYGMLSRVAEFGAPLAEIREGRAASGRTFHAAGGFRPHRRELRLRGGDGSGLAHDNFPALLRRRSDLFGFRDGADADDPRAQILWPRRYHHAAPPE